MDELIYKKQDREVELIVDDRRAAPRLEPSETRILIARLADGPEAELVNASSGGVLIKTRERLCPGSKVKLRLVTEDGVLVLSGRVLRSRDLDSDEPLPNFESAVAFEESLPPPLDKVLESSIERMLDGNRFDEDS